MKLIIDIVYYSAYFFATVIGVIKGNQMILETIIETKEKTIVKRVPTKFGYWFLGCIIMAFCLSLVRDNMSKSENIAQANKNKSDDSTTASINKKQIIDLERENSNRIVTAMKEAKEDNEEQINGTEIRMSKAFADESKKNHEDAKETQNNANINKQSLAKQIRDSIAKLKPANIYYAEGGQRTTHRQADDTLFINARIHNNGDLPANNLSFNVYYLYISEKNILYEYHNPLANIENIQLGPDDVFTLTDGNNFITPFVFDSSIDYQFILIKGFYNYTDTLDLLYKWSNKNMGWEIGNATKLELMHSLKNVMYF